MSTPFNKVVHSLRFLTASAIICFATLGTSSSPAPDRGFSFAAGEYNTPGHPELSPAQVIRIKQILAEVKPCQRPLVRYGLFGPSADDMVFFFKVPPGQVTHVLGAQNLYYNPRNGTMVPMPDNPNFEQIKAQGIQWDVHHEPCPSPAPEK